MLQDLSNIYMNKGQMLGFREPLQMCGQNVLIKMSHTDQLGKGTHINRDQGLSNILFSCFPFNYRADLGCGHWRLACWPPKPRASSLFPSTLGCNYNAIGFLFLIKQISAILLSSSKFYFALEHFLQQQSCNDIFTFQTHKKILQKAPSSQVYHSKLKPQKQVYSSKEFSAKQKIHEGVP